MRFEGIHHITCITADAPGNVDFYVRVLGLRLVKKSVNQDDPTVYHLFYADEKGSAGSDLTCFEYPQARRGRAGRGMVHTIVFRVGSDEALDFWADRLADAGNPGAGTVHHVAWASPPEEHEAWRERVAASGAHPTPVIDRCYFRSVYFREPSGVLFEIATIGPGFTVDEPAEHLGEKLSLPPDYEHLRATVEPVLTPLPNPRELVQR